MEEKRIFSFGGGVQSVAALVLAAQRRIEYAVFVFANVGDDSENPGTLEYLRDVAHPYAQEHGIKLVEAQKLYKGRKDTVLASLNRPNRSITIPVYMPSGAPGRRSCTTDYKVRVVDRYCRENAWERVTVGLGISLDEFHRMRDTHWTNKDGVRNLGFWKRREYPLIDLRLTRRDCEKLIVAAGLPVPPKSSCWFCPFQRLSSWVEMRRNNPEMFERAVQLEQTINRKRGTLGKDGVFLCSKGVPLSDAVPQQLGLFDDDGADFCDAGYCHT